jgi:hypothetical protein
MTRGRHTNTAYIATDTPDTELNPSGYDHATGPHILATILTTSRTEPSAHQASGNEHDHWYSLAQLIPECQEILNHAHQAHDALPDNQRLNHLRQHATSKTPARRPRAIAGLLPLPPYPLPPEHQTAINQRVHLINRRIEHLVNTTLEQQPPWLADLGPCPANKARRTRWQQALRTVVAYRDTYGINNSTSMLDDRPADPFHRTCHAAVMNLIRSIHSAKPPSPVDHRAAAVPNTHLSL